MRHVQFSMGMLLRVPIKKAKQLQTEFSHTYFKKRWRRETKNAICPQILQVPDPAVQILQIAAFLSPLLHRNPEIYGAKLGTISKNGKMLLG